MDYAVAIIGAGASGLMCAIEAAKRGKSVVVIEHNERIGNKIIVSGGGHCNFTNLNIQAENYISENPHFVKSALSRFEPEDFIKMLQSHNIPYEEKKLGQLFCKKSSQEIINMLKEKCDKSGATIFCNQKIVSIAHGKNFVIKSSRKEVKSESLVVATGGISYPSLVASDLGFKIAKQFKIKVTELRPALVPLLFNQVDRDCFSALSGVSFKAKVSCKKISFTDEILFTHRGLSGPAILNISSYWQRGEQLVIDILPDIDIYAEIIKKKQNTGKILIKNFLSNFMPNRIALTWCKKLKLTKNLASYSEKEIKKISEHLHMWRISPHGTEWYEKAEATRGGVDTSEISSKTMESAKIKGLYFIGEVLDVVGQLGGYNLHWAWASGFVAGKYV